MERLMMSIMPEDITIGDTARTAAEPFRDADSHTKVAYLRALAHELDMDGAFGGCPQLQAAILDAACETMGRKSLLQRAVFIRSLISDLGMDARLIVNGERRRVSLREKRESLETA